MVSIGNCAEANYIIVDEWTNKRNENWMNERTNVLTFSKYFMFGCYACHVLTRRTFPFKWNMHTISNKQCDIVQHAQNKVWTYFYFINGFLARCTIYNAFCFLSYTYIYLLAGLLSYLLCALLCCDSPTLKAGIIYKTYYSIHIGCCYCSFFFFFFIAWNGVKWKWRRSPGLLCQQLNIECLITTHSHVWWLLVCACG